MEPSVQQFLVPEASEAEFENNARLLTALPVPVANLFLPGSLKVVGPDLNMEAVLRYAETAFRRAQSVGVEHIVFGSGGARFVPDGFSAGEATHQFTRVLREMAPVAERYGVIVCLEPLRRQETNFLNTVPEAVAVLEGVAHPSVGLTFDIYHVLQERRSAEDVLAARRHIRHLHIAENTDRAAPGTHGDDFTPYFVALKAIGYSGRISVECSWRDKEAELAQAYDAVRAQILSIRA